MQPFWNFISFWFSFISSSFFSCRSLIVLWNENQHTLEKHQSLLGLQDASLPIGEGQGTVQQKEVLGLQNKGHSSLCSWMNESHWENATPIPPRKNQVGEKSLASNRQLQKLPLPLRNNSALTASCSNKVEPSIGTTHRRLISYWQWHPSSYCFSVPLETTPILSCTNILNLTHWSVTPTDQKVYGK